jgi:hypothetical protein
MQTHTPPVEAPTRWIHSDYAMTTEKQHTCNTNMKRVATLTYNTRSRRVYTYIDIYMYLHTAVHGNTKYAQLSVQH